MYLRSACAPLFVISNFGGGVRYTREEWKAAAVNNPKQRSSLWSVSCGYGWKFTKKKEKSTTSSDQEKNKSLDQKKEIFVENKVSSSIKNTWLCNGT